VRLLIIARPFVFHGGVERATAGLVGALVQHGYDVHLMSTRGQARVPGVTRHVLPLPPLPAVARALALAALARVAVSRGRWDVTQSHERTLRQDIYRAGEGCHRAYLDSMGDAARRRPLFHRVVLGLERRVFATTPHIVAISRRGAAEISDLHGVPRERLSVVYNGVDLERFHPKNRGAERRAARAEAGVAADAWTLLFVGSGFERKGLRTVIDALAALSDRASRLIVVGRGATRPFQEQAARVGVEGRIAWLGPRPDVERWYAAADVAVLPSRYEPFGNVHLEALASGVPVVTSAAAGGAEAIVDGRDGAVVDPRDACAVAAALGRLRERNPGELTEAARRAAEPFTFGRQIAEFARIYRRTMPTTCDFS
jgi:UDP-glucose:(heptosyl)LPS alpha-1,3-glucosyltransferase